MKRNIYFSLLCCCALAFASCDDKEDIGVIKDINLEYDGQEYDLVDSDNLEKRILHIYRYNGDQYVNYRADQRISLDKGTWKFVAALPIDSGMPAGNLNNVVIPLPTTASQKMVLSDPLNVKMPDDQAITLNMKTRTGALVIQAQDVKSDRRYNSIDIRTKVYQNGYMPGNQTYVDGETEVLRTAGAGGGGVNFSDEFYLYPTKDEASKVEIYLDFYDRTGDEPVLIKQQVIGQKFEVVAGRVDTIKITLNTEDYINQNFTVTSSIEEWSEEIVKPTIIPDGYTMISSDPGELATVLASMNSNPEVDEIKLYLPAGATYKTIGRINFTKSVTLIGELDDEDPDKRASMLSGNLTFSGEGVRYVHFENMDIFCKDNNLFVDVSGGFFDIENFSLINCTVDCMGRGLFRFTNGGTYHIRNFTIENSTFRPFATGGYAFIVTQNTSNFYHNFRAVNSTFYASASCNKSLFEGTGAVDTDMNLYFENCTFASNNTAYAWFDLRTGDVNPQPQISFTLLNSLFTAGDGQNPGYGLRYTDAGNVNRVIENIYCTAGWSSNTGFGVEPVEVGSKEDLFVNYTSDVQVEKDVNGDDINVEKGADLTIRDVDSPIYRNRIGDPRWIK